VKLLYIAVHGHEGWGAEHWLGRAFERAGLDIVRYDYRAGKKKLGRWLRVAADLRRIERRERPDVILVQRAERMPVWVLKRLTTPMLFWSTEPIQLKADVDGLLGSDIFSYVWVHTYGCLDRVREDFPHLIGKCSVMHNGFPAEVLNLAARKDDFAIFNRNISPRRELWIRELSGLVKLVSGRYGEDYFADLAAANISLNVHFSDKNLDDFESGIFEAMSQGCVVVTERLDPVTVKELGVDAALIQVDSPGEMRSALEMLKLNPQQLSDYKARSAEAVMSNTWDCRAKDFLRVFERVVEL
jgi:hypothetical protein